jgi:ribosomal protein L17
MVKKDDHSNKNYNYINIVNDLKGLGLLKSKRRQSERRQKQTQIIPPQLQGLVKTVIDNNPSLRQDLERLGIEQQNYRNKLMDNDDKFNYIYNNLDRFANTESNTPSSGLENVRSDFIKPPSVIDQFDKSKNLDNDSIDVSSTIPIFKSPNKQEPIQLYDDSPQTPMRFSSPNFMLPSENDFLNNVTPQKSTSLLDTGFMMSPTAKLLSPDSATKYENLKDEKLDLLEDLDNKKAESQNLKSSFLKVTEEPVEDNLETAKQLMNENSLKRKEIQTTDEEIKKKDKQIDKLLEDNDIKVAKNRSNVNKNYNDAKILNNILSKFTDEPLTTKEATKIGITKLKESINDILESSDLNQLTEDQYQSLDEYDKFLGTFKEYSDIYKKVAQYNEDKPNNRKKHVFEELNKPMYNPTINTARKNAKLNSKIV